MERDFDGAKAAVLLGERLLAYRRDDRAGLIWPGLWDFPGGGREAGESPDQTLGRELAEEFGLDLARGQIVWRDRIDRGPLGRGAVWFMVVRFPAAETQRIRFGAEGQYWRLFTPAAFMALSDVVPHLPLQFDGWRKQAALEARDKIPISMTGLGRKK